MAEEVESNGSIGTLVGEVEGKFVGSGAGRLVGAEIGSDEGDGMGASVASSSFGAVGEGAGKPSYSGSRQSKSLPQPAPQVYLLSTQLSSQQSPPSHEHASLLFSASHHPSPTSLHTHTSLLQVTTAVSVLSS